MISRRLAGLWGVVSFAVLAVAVPALLAWLEMPALVVWGGTGLVLVLFGLQVVSAWRGATGRSEPALFQGNALGRPVSQEYRPPACHRELPPDPAEQVVCVCAPVLQVAAGMGGLFSGGSASALGRGRSQDAANALVLTDRRFLFLVIGPEELRRFGSPGGASRLLQMLPGDAAAKRRMLWQHGGAEVRRALDGLLAGRELAELAAGQPGCSLPLADLAAWTADTRRGLVELHCGQERLRYSLRQPEQAGRLAAGLQGLGLPPAA